MNNYHVTWTKLPRLALLMLLTLASVSACNNTPAPLFPSPILNTHSSNAETNLSALEILDKAVLDQAAEHNGIIKSPNDHRQYRYLQLENGLKVILVSDKHTDKSAAAMNVHIGHMADPKDREGLSHFLEHMLFLGTKKYPETGEYKQFLKANGGRSNASTSPQHTRYYFQVNEHAFEQATDRFAQFFIAPTFDPAYVDREKSAIEAEYRLKIKNEGRRLREVLKDTRNQDHAASQFSVGNLHTLADRENDLLIDALTAHYAKYYSASIMTLALVGKEDLNALEQLAREMFSPIANNGFIAQPETVAPYTAEQLGVQINVEPLSKTKQLRLSFPLPHQGRYFANQPLTLIASLIGHEGKGSLYSYLKTKGAITSLSTGFSRVGNAADDVNHFVINIKLTRKGLKQYQKITETVFAYLGLLNNAEFNQGYFQELATIKKNAFAFKANATAANTARYLASQLPYFSPENIWRAPYLYTQYSDELHQHYLSYLTPKNMRLTLTGRGVSTDKIQPEYNTPYSINKLSEKELKRYQAPAVINALTLPEPNPFIATKLRVNPVEKSIKVPEVIFEQAGFNFWHQQDSDFNVPKSSVSMRIYTPLAGSNARAQAMNKMLISTIKENLNEYSYPAKLAGLTYKISTKSNGVEIEVFGFDEKLITFLQTINAAIHNVKVTKKSFKRHKKKLKTSANKLKFSSPLRQAYIASALIQRPEYYSITDIADAAKDISKQDFTRYLKNVFNQPLHIDVLAHGNMPRSTAKTLAKQLYTLNMANASAGEKPAKAVKLNHSNTALIHELAINHNDSVLMAQYGSADNSIHNRARYALLGKMLEADFFKSIRTKQQLGYAVRAKATAIAGYPGLALSIQSPVVGPVELTRRVDEFFTGFTSTLTLMNNEPFKQYKQGLIESLQAKDTSLINRSKRYWRDIENSLEKNAKKNKVQFDTKQQLIAALTPLTKQDMISFYQQEVLKLQPIIVRSFGKKHQDTDDYQQAKSDESICRATPCSRDKLSTVIAQ